MSGRGMKWRPAFAALMMLIVAGCGTSGAAIRSGCEWAKPIWPSKADVLTRETEDQIFIHNETWERLCRQ